MAVARSVDRQEFWRETIERQQASTSTILRRAVTGIRLPELTGGQTTAGSLELLAFGFVTPVKMIIQYRSCWRYFPRDEEEENRLTAKMLELMCRYSRCY